MAANKRILSERTNINFIWLDCLAYRNTKENPVRCLVKNTRMKPKYYDTDIDKKIKQTIQISFE